ncbi:MAG TPA: T9SS type A sorting domain-containing protein [Melioribacteraceae bacterium]|nr:T9SS type A sorting domain-containing protein [Melioribacteraceae bacterium]
MKLIRSSFYLAFALILLCSFSLKAEGVEGKEKGKVYKTAGTPGVTKFNINNISTFFGNDGISDLSTTGDSGFQFPIGSGKTVFYESGFVYGGDFPLDDGTKEFRISGSTYNRGQQPGRILPDGTREDSNLPHVRIYRVRPDYKDPQADYSKEILDEGKTQAAIYAQYDKDWQEWPAQYGAPYKDVNGNGTYEPAVDIPGVPGADQTIWFVANDVDDTQAQKLYGSKGFGIEMQATIFGYNQQNALGDALFRKYMIINKTNKTFTDFYVCMWSDPDLGGDAGDDFAGVDTVLSLGYIYNGDDSDPSYGSNIPSSGFDFLQGPIVPGNPGDHAIFKNKIKTGYVNLGASAFFLFTQSVANWSDPTLGNYANGALRFRNLFEGKNATLGTPFIDPLTGKTSKYFAPGDPVAGTGWIDGILFPKQDRRIGLVAGPFTMAAGDTQEVVVGQLAAGGVAPVTRLGAVALLKYQDLQVQQAYNNFFQVPNPPAAPIVPLDEVTKIGKASEFDQQLVISWGEDQARVAQIESHDQLGYKFEGYVVYQLPRLNAQLNEAKVVATYDLNNLIGNVESLTFDANTNNVTRSVTKFGRNEGIQRSITITKDMIRDGIPLANGTEYYFVVSAYSVNPDPNAVPNVLETLSARIVATPHQPNPGTIYEGTTGQVITATHTTGTSDGSVKATVYDPAKLTGDTYQVSFAKVNNQMVWNLKNTTKNTTPVTNVTDQSASPTSPFVDGVQVKVSGAPNDFKNFEVLANANGPLNPPASVSVNWTESLGGRWPNAGAGQQKSGAVWVLGSNGGTDYAYSYWVGRVTQYTGGFGSTPSGVAALVPDDFEFRFTATGSEAFLNWTTGGFMQVPFEIWNTRGTASTADDFMCMAWVLDDGDGIFQVQAVDNVQSGGTNDPQTDAIYFLIPLDKTPGKVGYNNLLAKHKANPAGASADVLWAYYDDVWGSYPGMMRLVFVGFNLIDASQVATLPAEKKAPEQGTIIKISTTKPNQLNDVFTFTTPKVVKGNVEAAKEEVEKINVFPNPYYGVNPREINKYQRFVTFSHLPEKATLRIFNLAGQLVRTIEKNSPSQFMTWDLLNESDFPVASGLYIVYVDMPELGKTKVIKLAVIQEQQILDHY